MKRRFLSIAGLCLAPILGLALAHGGEPGKPPPGNPFDQKSEETSCGKHGTTVAFEDNPVEAGKKAKKEEKLVMVLHVSGLFEDPNLT